MTRSQRGGKVESVEHRVHDIPSTHTPPKRKKEHEGFPGYPLKGQKIGGSGNSVGGSSMKEFTPGTDQGGEY